MSESEIRVATAFKVRKDAAEAERQLPLQDHPKNLDEINLQGFIGNFSKGLPHNDLGEVDKGAYNLLLQALKSGKPVGFEEIPLAGARRLTNPQAGLAFDLEGTDSHALYQAPPPAFSSAEEAGEIVENYWMAIARDVHFSDYAQSPIIASAAADITNLSAFKGPKDAAHLFRGTRPGDLKGPYLSQFMWQDVPFGAQKIVQTMKTVVSSKDYMTDYPAWLAVQRGATAADPTYDGVARYIRSGRDLSEWVHVDALYQAYFNACLILLGLGAPVDKNNPYTAANSKKQDGFGTFGGPHILSLVTEVATRALKAVWFQKWYVHRRLRPEAFAGRIHNHKSGNASYPIHEDALGSAAVAKVKADHGTYLLPMAFPEGSPLHPAYGAGHATVAGACVTILKAWFDETALLQPLLQARMKDVVVSSADGRSLVPYTGADAGALTVGGELDKLASNVAIGRNFAGVHWRSDYVASVELGEQVAISVLRDQKATYNEAFKGFSLTRFDGTTITV